MLYLDPPHDPLDQIRRALARAPHIASHRLDVSLEDNAVILAGSVRSWYQKQVAQESVRGIAGVTRVRNRIRVIPR